MNEVENNVENHTCELQELRREVKELKSQLAGGPNASHAGWKQRVDALKAKLDEIAEKAT